MGGTVHGARRRTDDPPGEPDLAAEIAAASALRDRAGERLAQAARLLDAADAGQPLPEGLDRRAVAELRAGLRHLGGETAAFVRELERIRFGQVFGTAAETWVREDERQQLAALGPGRHRAGRSRKPGKGQRALFAVRDEDEAAAHPGRSTAVKVGVAAAGIAVAGLGLGTGQFADLANYGSAGVAHHAVSSLPVLGPVVARPLIPQPSRAAYEGRHRKARQSPDASGATLAPPPPVVTVGPPSPPPPSAAPSAAPSGTLDVQTVACTIGLSGQCYVTFWAVGGPVQWQASASDPLSVDQGQGVLAAGESVTVTVSVAGGSLAGSGTVTLTAGDGQQEIVPVTWVSLPAL